MKALPKLTYMRWYFKFLLVDGWPNLFALLAFFYCGYMLDKGHLTVQAQTRFEDFIAVIISYYFVASNKTAKTDTTLQTMADTQKHMASNVADKEEENKDI